MKNSICVAAGGGGVSPWQISHELYIETLSNELYNTKTLNTFIFIALN